MGLRLMDLQEEQVFLSSGIGGFYDSRALEKKRLSTVMNCFHALFLDSHQTRLVGHASEPLYVPAGKDSCVHTIYYVGERVASALHEISHWCIAGQKRRQKIDYGYWYEPPGNSGRKVGQQQAFQNVEIKPQALEWIFSSALKKKFFVSADNFASCNLGQSLHFKTAIRDQALSFISDGMPKRSNLFLSSIIDAWHTESYFTQFWEQVARVKQLPE